VQAGQCLEGSTFGGTDGFIWFWPFRNFFIDFDAQSFIADALKPPQRTPPNLTIASHRVKQTPQHAQFSLVEPGTALM
jgi:hypothetical protein